MVSGSSGFYILVVFIGAFALMGAIIWARMNNKVTPEQHRRTEEATRRNYQEGPVEGGTD